MTIDAAADGSSLGNPGPSGWGWYVDADHWAAGGWARGTNNMGELMAVLDLLRQSAELPDDLRVHCDSRYVIDAVTKWTPGWKARGWRRADGQPVLNLELIQAIDEAMTARRKAGRKVEFVWVKGHAGHPLNEAADRLANGAATAYQNGSVPDPGPGFTGYAAGPAPRRTAAAEPVRMAPTRAHTVASAEPAGLFSLTATGPESADVPDDLETVIELERSLLAAAVRTRPRALEALLHPDWSEVGSSGRLLERESVVGGLAPVQAQLEVIEASKLADDVVLLVWRAVGPERASLRSSVWVRVDGQWRQRFHQGTVQA